MLLKHLLGLEPEPPDPIAREWESLRAQAVAEFLPEVESSWIRQKTLAAIDARQTACAKLSIAGEF
jgi:hypothetical protein